MSNERILFRGNYSVLINHKPQYGENRKSPNINSRYHSLVVRPEIFPYLAEEEVFVVVIGDFAGGAEKRLVSRHHVTRCHDG